jgi:hypothetical protein
MLVLVEQSVTRLKAQAMSACSSASSALQPPTVTSICLKSSIVS